MRDQLGQASMSDVQACLDGGAVKIEPQRHNVDEQAHRVAAPAPPCMRPNSTVRTPPAHGRCCAPPPPPHQVAEASQGHIKPPRLAAHPRILRQRPPSLRDPAAVAVGPRLSRTAGPAQPYLRATSGRTPHAPLHQRSRAPPSPHCKRDVGLSGYAHVPPARPNSTRPTEMRPAVF